MKRIIYTLLFLCFCVTSNIHKANAQDVSKGISINNLKTSINEAVLDIDFTLLASGLSMKCDGQLTLEFAIESDDRRLVLPVVVYSGKQRYNFERRRETLSGEYHVEPYHIYKGVKKNKTYELDYHISIPYYTWMKHASITYCEYLHDCDGDYLNSNGLLLADLNRTEFIVPEVWAPNSALYPNLVSFLVPEVESVKARASMIQLDINFPVNVTTVRPTYMNNPRELKKADSLILALSQNQHIDIRGVNIQGYASPDGSYSNNERLARGRSQGFKTYLASNYPSNQHIRNATTQWVPEDWDGLAILVQESNILRKDDVLSIIHNESLLPDAKDAQLKTLQPWSSIYKVILEDMYPKLRRIELRVDYTIHNLTDSEAREMLYTQPELLSLDEMFRVAQYYEAGSNQYREVYEIAAKQYPRDIIANNNAAAALLRDGNAEDALKYLEKTKGADVASINYGAYYYIMGDLDKALEYFNKAKESGIEQADHNIILVTSILTK